VTEFSNLIKMKNPLIRILAGVVGGVVGFLVVSAMFHNGEDQGSLDANLNRVADELNKKLPMMVDEQTRLDQVSAKTGTLIYSYSLPNENKGDVDFSTLQKKLRPNIIANYRDNQAMKELRKWNVGLDYQYKDKNGETIGEILVTPKDFE
jgi:hypothetical protein